MAQTHPDTLISSFAVQNIFLGINCVLYAFCLYTLWGQKSISCRLLLFINTAQFLLCVTQTILHTILYFIVLTVLTGDIQQYLHHVNVYILGSVIIFSITFIAAGFLSIWRLYFLYDNDIRVCIPPFIVWIAQICMSAITIRNCATTPGAATRFSPINMSLWALITAVNLCVAIPIGVRLCIAQKHTRTVLSASPYTSAVIVSVECGALILACSLAMTILYACNYTYALVSIGVAVEIATASQLLVTARHGMLSQGQRHDDTTTFSPTSTARAVNVMRTAYSSVAPPLLSSPVKTKSPYPFAKPTSHAARWTG